MHDLLVQQGVVKMFLGKSKKPAIILDEEWEEIDVTPLSAIHLCLADDVLFSFFFLAGIRCKNYIRT
jgi:hypothetical protein